MAYCTYELVGINLSLAFDETTSKPKASQVTTIIDMVTAEIDLILTAKGIQIPVAGTNLYKLLTLQCSQGSAGRVAMAYYGNAESVIGSQGQFYWTEYQKFLSDLKSNPDYYRAMLHTSLIGNQVTNGTTKEADIEKNMIGDEWIA